MRLGYLDLEYTTRLIQRVRCTASPRNHCLRGPRNNIAVPTPTMTERSSSTVPPPAFTAFSTASIDGTWIDGTWIDEVDAVTGDLPLL